LRLLSKSSRAASVAEAVSGRRSAVTSSLRDGGFVGAAFGIDIERAEFLLGFLDSFP
jgi:hypothetical protein